MSKRLPDIIEPLRLAEKDRLLQGRLAVAKMKRLASSLADTEGEVEVDLQFSLDEGGQPNIQGRLSAQLKLICQRCMQEMTYAANSKVSLAIVNSEALAEKLPDNYEPLLLLSGAEVSLSELVEDELILTLPAVAMHAIDECPAGDQFRSSPETNVNSGSHKTAELIETTKPNPFAVLEQLKSKK